MKKLLGLILLTINAPSFAVEGYDDIYIDREKDIVIHGIVCGPDINKFRALKPSIVYTNTESILKGTYYYNSRNGNYSLTFNTTKNVAIMARGLLQKGQTKKEQMVKSHCIVSNIKGLPAPITKNLKKVTLKANDPNWDKVMTQYTFVSGKPAYGKGVFQDQRSTAKFDATNKSIFDANQKYLNTIETLFGHEYKKIAGKLPKSLKEAIKYAHKTDGSFEGKTYPAIKKPTVWTPTSKERYNDLSRRRGQRIAWDKVIQQNFDWFFALTGKDNTLKNTRLISNTKPTWNGRALEQVATVQAQFKNGKTLELDFIITSSKVGRDIFATMEDIKKATLLSRTSAIVSARKEIKPIAMPTKNSLSVYTPTEKKVIFFSPFRNKSLGDTYRYQ